MDQWLRLLLMTLGSNVSLFLEHNMKVAKLFSDVHFCQRILTHLHPRHETEQGEMCYICGRVETASHRHISSKFPVKLFTYLNFVELKIMLRPSIGQSAQHHRTRRQQWVEKPSLCVCVCFSRQSVCACAATVPMSVCRY